MHQDHESIDQIADFRTRFIRPFSALRRSGNLFLLTILSAIDGTLVMLAASGKLNTFGGAVVVGLTVIAGAGSWIAAKDAFGSGALSREDRFVMAGLASVTLLAATAAVWLGASIGAAMTLHVLPKATGIVIILIGAQIMGLRMPKLVGLPVPLFVIATSILLEVITQWTQ